MSVLGHEVAQKTDNETAYLMLKIAMERYQCHHSELKKEQQVEVLNQAFKLQQLNHTILASPQADEIEVPENEIESTLKQIMGRYETVDEFEQAISHHGISQIGFRELLASELKVNAVLEKISDGVEITQQEIEEYYQNNQRAFLQPEMRKVRHILITLDDNVEGDSQLDALLRISLIANEVAGEQQKFEEFALKKSECPTALNGGLVGTIPKGQLFPELDEELFMMEEGVLSEPVETQIGFHLLWCEAIHPERLIPLDEANLEIKKHLEDKKRFALQKRWIAQEVQKHKIYKDQVSKAANH